MIERIGTGADPAKACKLFTVLHGDADVLFVGGIDLDFPSRE